MNLSDTDVRRQIERLLSSKSLKGSEVHRRLLVFLSEKSLAGEGDSLKEYSVALDALGKQPTYDPRHDSTVRIHIGRLRNKLTEYYSSEGASDPIFVSLPKGGFKVNFEPASAGRTQKSGWRARRLALIAMAAVAIVSILWAVLATARLTRLQREMAPVAEAWNPDLEEFWSPILDSKRPLLLCVGTPLFASFPNNGFIRVPGANTWEDLRKTRMYSALIKPPTIAGGVPWYAYTGVGEASAAVLVGKLLGTRRRDILVTRSNLLSWQEISDTNLVFLGPPKFNLQLAEIPARKEIAIEPDGIRIANPGPGEPAFLPDHFSPGPNHDGITHALIGRTPGLSGHGEMVTLAGNGTPDTLAAAQWVTFPGFAAELARHVRLPSGKLPEYFQLVLKVQFRNGVPVDSSYVLHRVLKAH